MTGQAFIGGGFLLLVGVPLAIARDAVPTALGIGLGSIVLIGTALVIIRRDL